ncbi:MAG: hypothetical protein GIW99_06900 [Candidatus Eremiobacteraeota bacterium]|nr:hypothetical protein [Candidatus Eremiobacteraeota bacterium]MBC5827393.1 hypothetical protein [Candidatus Eremiobacteraeota bacterium]
MFQGLIWGGVAFAAGYMLSKLRPGMGAKVGLAALPAVIAMMPSVSRDIARYVKIKQM